MAGSRRGGSRAIAAEEDTTDRRGDQQQMLTIARSLMGNPRLFLLDELSEGLARRDHDRPWPTASVLDCRSRMLGRRKFLEEVS